MTMTRGMMERKTREERRQDRELEDRRGKVLGRVCSQRRWVRARLTSRHKLRPQAPHSSRQSQRRQLRRLMSLLIQTLSNHFHPPTAAISPSLLIFNSSNPQNPFLSFRPRQLLWPPLLPLNSSQIPSSLKRISLGLLLSIISSLSNLLIT
jgi:hypothetical protein